MDGKFKDWGAKEWIEYYDSLNAGVPVDKVRLDLTEEEKQSYIKAAEELADARKSFPGASYEVKYSWFE